jgi:hypothetical protein
MIAGSEDFLIQGFKKPLKLIFIQEERGKGKT